MQPRTKSFLIGGAAIALALTLPAIAQGRPESILPPGFGDPATPAPDPATNEAQPVNRQPVARQPAGESAVQITDLLSALDELAEAEPVRQVEYPSEARRDPRFSGALDPVAEGLGPRPWGAASGKAMQILMRRMDTPLASRWTHIA